METVCPLIPSCIFEPFVVKKEYERTAKYGNHEEHEGTRRNTKEHEGTRRKCYGADRSVSIEEAKWVNYLKATGLKIGLVINFGAYEMLEWKRFVV